MPTENGNKRLAPGTLPARLELGCSTSLRHTHVRARRRTGAPPGQRSLTCAFDIDSGGLGRGRWPVHRNCAKKRTHSLAHICPSEQSHGKTRGEAVRMSRRQRFVGLLVGLHPAVPQTTWKMQVENSEEKVSCVTIPVGGGVLGEGSLLVENSSHPSLAPQTRQIWGVMDVFTEGEGVFSGHIWIANRHNLHFQLQGVPPKCRHNFNSW